MTKIYRIQHKETKDGVYKYRGESPKYSEQFGEIVCNGDSSEVHPGPLDDSLFKDNYLEKGGSALDIYFKLTKYIFGFESIEQLRFWLYNDSMICFLAEWDFELVIYESENVIVGNTQVAFEKESAKIIEKNPLLDLLNK